MSSDAFRKALQATGYLGPEEQSAPGLVTNDAPEAARLRAVLKDARVGLKADAVFSAQNVPTSIFKDAGDFTPSEEQVDQWREAAWNIGVAPLLWIITPTEVRLYNCYASPWRGTGLGVAEPPLDRFDLATDDRLRALDAMCGRVATETGAFWSSLIGKRIDRQYRVDRELLAEINALEGRLTELPPVQSGAHLDGENEIAAARDFAQRLIGRCIFTWYLLDRGIAQPFLPCSLPDDLAAMMATPTSAFNLFDWLRDTFNGDLFPMDDPGAEQMRLGPAHLELVRDFVEGSSLVPENHGQKRLFRFRFDAIPVDLVSSIYQQFARSSAEKKARVQGLHYTPVELVHLTLDPVFEDLPATARLIDPTCGSGAFLVEAFRRLIWKRCGDEQASRAVVRDILYNQLFGIDINPSALGIAAFSLYLAALEFDEEPITDIADLKFDRLIGTTLFEADAIGEDLPAPLVQSPFEAVVGNPPWTFDKSIKAKPRDKSNARSLRPRRSPDWAFLDVAATLAGEKGRIGMVMKASPFFSKDEHAVEARAGLLSRMKPAALVNLSALRKEHLFPNATGPALLFFARCSLMPEADQLLVGSIPWTPDFVRNGLFQVGPGELRMLPLRRVLRTPAMLKAATFGTVRDSWLIERLEREFPTLGETLDSLGIVAAEGRGQGYQVKGNPNFPPDYFYDTPTLTPDDYKPFRIDSDALPPFSEPTLHRIRNTSIYRGPLLLCPKASFKLSVEEGRYSAARVPHDILYTESFYGISFADHASELAAALSGILNSCVTTFQLAYGGGAWGLERSTVEPKDLLSLRVPDLRRVDAASLQLIAEAEAAVAREATPEHFQALDAAVAELYEFDRHELVLARESIERARVLIFEGRKRRLAFVKPPQREPLKAYAATVTSVVDGYLRRRGVRHLEASVYTRPLVSASWADGGAGLTAIRFRMSAGAPPREPAIALGDDAELTALADQLKGWVKSDMPPYLNERRNLRLYLGDSLFIVKPSEVRYWTKTAGLNDADVILADHWLKASHAV
ncbi:MULTISPECIES: HsdM family class I SAM-dependent methyltransferase [Phaeobacter]|uniref:HsdM family class I SAM-dependent methyltransferase n=1 Tax=Phaeobacter TaxID=302485 RepID=UPI003A83A85A